MVRRVGAEERARVVSAAKTLDDLRSDLRNALVAMTPVAREAPGDRDVFAAHRRAEAVVSAVEALIAGPTRGVACANPNCKHILLVPETRAALPLLCAECAQLFYPTGEARP
jgi:hypothetical protein